MSFFLEYIVTRLCHGLNYRACIRERADKALLKVYSQGRDICRGGIAVKGLITDLLGIGH